MDARTTPLRRILRATLTLSLGAALLSPVSARAGDDGPAVIVAGDGTVDGRVVVGAPPDVVDAYLADVGSLRRHNKNVTSVDVTAQGDCQLVDTTAKSIVEMSYVARRCPTNSGWVETLLDSEMMTDYYAEWFVTPVPNGIEIRFRLRTEMDLPVPSRMVRGAIKKSVFASLDRMQGTLGGPDAPPRQVAEE